MGIIGRNGAGKSTLLKVLSRITEPSAGRVTIKGRVASLLEVGTGFHPELTGRENIFLNGAILGMKRTEIKAKFDEIVAFAEVEKFLDTPVKRYSSGMYVRLAFAVAAHLEPEILVVDEVLAVGDAEFQRKCLGKMGDITGRGRTVLFVSHNMVAIGNLCVRTMLLDKGHLELNGPTSTVIERYLHRNNTDQIIQDLSGTSVGGFSFRRFWMENPHGKTVGSVSCGQRISFLIEYTAKSVIEKFSVAMGIFDSNGARVSHVSMMDQNLNACSGKTGKARCTFRKFPLTCGAYTVNIGVYNDNVPLSILKNAARIVVEDGDYFEQGAFRPGLRLGPTILEHNWKIEADE